MKNPCLWLEQGRPDGQRAEGRCIMSCTCIFSSKRKHWTKALTRHISNLDTSSWWTGPYDKQHNWPYFDLSKQELLARLLSCKCPLEQNWTEQNTLLKLLTQSWWSVADTRELEQRQNKERISFRRSGEC